jgi:GntR family transcriptional regulator/MocR family aminotransferase
MKRLYSARRRGLLEHLAQIGPDRLKVEATAGMAVVVSLPASVSDVEVWRRALAEGLAPGALSNWYVTAPARQGLLLGVTNLDDRRLGDQCRQLAGLVA